MTLRTIKSSTTLSNHRPDTEHMIGNPLNLIDMINWDIATVFGRVPPTCPKGQRHGWPNFGHGIRYSEFSEYEKSEYGYGGFQIPFRKSIDILNERSPQAIRILGNYWGTVTSVRLDHLLNNDEQVIRFVVKVRRDLPSLRFISVDPYSNRNWNMPLRGTNMVWHAGNTGAGSGLDVDMLDGYNAGSWTYYPMECHPENGRFQGSSLKSIIFDEKIPEDFVATPPRLKLLTMNVHNLNVPKFWFASEVDALAFKVSHADWAREVIDNID